MTVRTFISRFSPNRTDPKVLESIFVQRHALADTWFERLKDAALTPVKHHFLAVGPRGSGKSHLVSLLVDRLLSESSLSDCLRIAWLPEDETTASFWKFLLRILRALNAEYRDEFPLPSSDQLAAIGDEGKSEILISQLLKGLSGRSLLVVVENLDDVMRGLKSEGQKRWRAFLQEHPVASTLATAQRLTKDVASRDRPFFNFFEIEHLQPLSSDDALALLQKIARQVQNDALVSFLETPVGRARVRAIRHVAGGSHRIFIILSEFLTREALDDLVVAFEDLLDELTPYYQERLRWLPEQQREIVEFLCRQIKTVQVKDIAKGVYLSEQTAAAQLKTLRDKGYVVSEMVGRESRYELAEPLMRLCVEVKDPRREPIRLIVEFLRVWYDRQVLEVRLQRLPSEASVERRFFQAALDGCLSGLPSPVQLALDQDLEAARATGDQEEVVRILVELGATADESSRCVLIAAELRECDRPLEALSVCERAIEIEQKSGPAWGIKGAILCNLRRWDEMVSACEQAIEISPELSDHRMGRALALYKLGRNDDALRELDSVVASELNVTGWVLRGRILEGERLLADALGAFDIAIELQPGDATPWLHRGHVLMDLGQIEEALTTWDHLIELSQGEYKIHGWLMKGIALSRLGRGEKALSTLRHCLGGEAEGNASILMGVLLYERDQFEEADAAIKRAIEIDASDPLARLLHGCTSLALGDFDGALDSSLRAVALDHECAAPLEVAAQAYLMQGNWDGAERMLEQEFRLPPAVFRETTWFLDKILAGVFAATGSTVWKSRVNRILEIAEAASERWASNESQGDAGSPSVASPIAVIGSKLVRSLVDKRYADQDEQSQNRWVGVWEEAVADYPDLSLAVRIFGVGMRYVQTADPRVLLDLVQEERTVLEDLFGLGESR